MIIKLFPRDAADIRETAVKYSILAAFRVLDWQSGQDSGFLAKRPRSTVPIKTTNRHQILIRPLFDCIRIFFHFSFALAGENLRQVKF